MVNKLFKLYDYTLNISPGKRTLKHVSLFTLQKWLIKTDFKCDNEILPYKLINMI